MNKKSAQKTQKIRKNGKLILLFGILSALIAGFVLYTAIDLLHQRDGRAVPVLVLCFSVLFSLISVMINKTSKESRNWADSLLITLAAQTVIETALLPFLGSAIHPAEIICLALTALAAAGLYLTKKNIRRDNRIPFVLAFIAAGTGLIMLNTTAWLLFSGGNISRLWIGIFFTALFLLLAQTLVSKAAAPEQRNKAWFRLFLFGLAVQCAAMINAIAKGSSGGLLIFHICILAGLSAGAVFFYIKAGKRGYLLPKKR